MNRLASGCGGVGLWVRLRDPLARGEPGRDEAPLSALLVAGRSLVINPLWVSFTGRGEGKVRGRHTTESKPGLRGAEAPALPWLFRRGNTRNRKRRFIASTRECSLLGICLFVKIHYAIATVLW